MSEFKEAMKKAVKRYPYQKEFLALIAKLTEKNINFTIDTFQAFSKEVATIQVRIDPEYNPNCIDFVIGYGLYGLEMGWRKPNCKTVSVKGYVSADEAIEFVTQKVPLPKHSD